MPQLCVRVQPLAAGAAVFPGTTAKFAIWVWTTKAASTGVAVQLSVAAASGLGAPAFTVCPHSGSSVCTVGNLAVGTADELQAAIRTTSSAAPGEKVTLIAKASATGSAAFTGSASDVVQANAGASGTTSPQPPVNLPVPSTLPSIPGTAVSPANPANLFPTVKASSPPDSLVLPKVTPRTARIADASSTVPLDSRLIGGQVAGLLVLLGAVTIAIARLSLRRPKPERKPTSGQSDNS